jgi:hypothetical protein
MVALPIKLVPSTVSVKLPPPAVVLGGESWLTVGTAPGLGGVTDFEYPQAKPTTSSPTKIVVFTIFIHSSYGFPRLMTL